MNQETQKLLDVLAGAVTREEMEVVVYAWQEAGSPDSTPPVKLALANEIVRLLNTAEIFLTTTVGLAVLSVGSKQAATFERCARAKLGEITTEFAAAYAATYSEEALRATVDCYSTPAGLECARGGPAASAAMKDVVEAWTASVIAEVEASP